jgi:hypothetical protein
MESPGTASGAHEGGDQVYSRRRNQGVRAVAPCELPPQRGSSGGTVQEGYAIETASNGLQALNAASRVSLDAIVLDLMMPVMDGRSFLARCRTQPWCHEVPVVRDVRRIRPNHSRSRVSSVVQAYAPLAPDSPV